MYLSYPSSAYPGQQKPNGPVTYERQPDQMSYPTSTAHERRSKHGLAQSSLADPGNRELLEVTSYTPDRGLQGSYVYVYIQTSYDLAENPFNISFMFAARPCIPTLDRLESHGAHYNYLLAAQAPPQASTGWASPNVPLRLQMQQVSGYDIGSIEVGSFFYTDGVPLASYASPQDPSRKRKISLDSADLTKIPAKRASYQHLSDSPANHMATHYATSQSRAFSYPSQPSTSVYGPSNIRSSTAVQESSASLQNTRSVQSGTDKSTYCGGNPSSRSSAWSSPFTSTSGGHSTRSPALSTSSSSSRFQALGSPDAGHPQLKRTSTIQPSHASSGSVASALYPYGYKAVLNINGDLNTMTEGWSTEEVTAKRRLVQFWRSQNNNTITADFAPASAEGGPPKGICISCIWWAERQECYVTSVDTIHLLESLVAVRFEVEEKNRIRRNLEGFRPTTVSKAKNDSEDFFSVIMGFPNPKPRNIEKDVKVFPWKILNHALKKIIGKYVSYPITS